MDLTHRPLLSSMASHLLDEVRPHLVEARRWTHDGSWTVHDRIIPRPIFWLVERGRIPITLDQTHHTLEVGDVMLYHPGSVLTAELSDSDPPSLISVHFHARVLGDQEIVTLVGSPSKPSSSVTQRVRPILERLHRYAQRQRPTDALIISACLYEALAHLLEESICHDVFLPANPHVVAALRYINSDHHDSHNVDSVAKAVGVSPSHLRSLFKEHLGISPLEYMHWVKLNSACALLADSTMTIEQVAFTLDFRDASYFSRWFAKATGCAPSVYRQRFLM